MNIITSKLLLEKTKPFVFGEPNDDIPDIVEFSIELSDLMHKSMALGLAANQVGYRWSIFGMLGSPESFICINPRIVNTYTEVVELEETSPCYPGLVFKKERPKHVRLRFQGPNGDTFTRDFTGFTARVIYQMMDHLEGRPFWDGISKLRFDMAIDKARKRGFDYRYLPYKVGSSIIAPNETPRPMTGLTGMSEGAKYVLT